LSAAISRIAAALGHWLGESFGEGLRLVPDLDEVPALSIEREALWKRVGEASFLTDDEKRAAAGYEPLPASSLLAKYSPDQPRVPGGNPDGGQWTSGGGYAGSATDGDDGRLLSDANSDVPVVGAEYAQNYDRIDLTEEEIRGHAMEEHVGKSEAYLKARVVEEAIAIVKRRHDFRGLSVGSFNSFAAATALVNSTLSQNRDVVDRVAKGLQERAFVHASFGSVTGQEAHLSRIHSQPYIRSTFGVGVVIVRDPRSSRGFRIQSAYPRN
jgi:hypothetical protein